MGEGDAFKSLVQLMLAMVVVFGSLFALRYYLLRSKERPTIEGPGLITLRDRLQIGPRSFAHVLQVGKEVFLVCITETSVEIRPLNSVEPTEPTAPRTSPQFAASLLAAYEHLRQGRRE